MKLKLLIISLFVLILIFPLIAVQGELSNDFSRIDLYPYIFKAKIIERTDEFNEGQMQSFLIKQIKGNLPKSEFIVTSSKPWSMGLSKTGLKINQELWLQGNLIKSGEGFYQREYDTIIIRQIKGKFFWPGQIPELKNLYLKSPIIALFSPLAPLMMAPGGGDISKVSWIIGIILVLGTFIMLMKNIHKKWNLLLILLVFYLLSMVYYRFFLPI